MMLIAALEKTKVKSFKQEVWKRDDLGTLSKTMAFFYKINFLLSSYDRQHYIRYLLVCT